MQSLEKKEHFEHLNAEDKQGRVIGILNINNDQLINESADSRAAACWWLFVCSWSMVLSAQKELCWPLVQGEVN